MWMDKTLAIVFSMSCVSHFQVSSVAVHLTAFLLASTKAAVARLCMLLSNEIQVRTLAGEKPTWRSLSSPTMGVPWIYPSS